MTTLKIRFALVAPTILATTLAFSPARAFAQTEAPAAAEVVAPAEEAAKPAAPAFDQRGEDSCSSSITFRCSPPSARIVHIAYFQLS